ncbi:MAG: hypothetical protein FJ147_22210 [Deltaproteobacteria bacterium]|nr:hypothetical protein [Deltaproteobacteria bacterium]
MVYRSKSPSRALAELEALGKKWQLELVEVVDNILDMKYFNDMLPQLAQRHSPAQLFYEVKANLNRRQVAFYFDFDYEPNVNPHGVADDVIAYVTAWQREGETGRLTAVSRADGSLLLVDTRPTAQRHQVLLKGVEKAAYTYCDEARSCTNVTQYLREQFPEAPVTAARVGAWLDALVAQRLMVSDGKRYLNLAIPTQPVHTPSEALPFA